MVGFVDYPCANVRLELLRFFCLNSKQFRLQF
jgi:hypothetical protein